MARQLRIAASVFFGTLTVALCMLWVRSYWRAGICGLTFNHEKRTNFASEYGRVFLIVFDCETYVWAIGKPRDWDLRSVPHSSLYPTARTEGELLKQMDAPPFPGFYFRQFAGFYRVIVPYWFLIVVAASLVAVPWIRFSLRALLIATTLVAVLLWLVVWAWR